MNKGDREKLKEAVRLLREVLERHPAVTALDEIDPEGGAGGPGTPPPPPPPPGP